MSSEIAGIIKLLDLAIKITDLATAGSIAQEEYNRAVDNINTKLKRARAEGRDVSWDEIDESQDRLNRAIEQGKQMHDPS